MDKSKFTVILKLTQKEKDCLSRMLYSQSNSSVKKIVKSTCETILNQLDY